MATRILAIHTKMNTKPETTQQALLSVLTHARTHARTHSLLQQQQQTVEWVRNGSSFPGDLGRFDNQNISQ